MNEVNSVGSYLIVTYFKNRLLVLSIILIFQGKKLVSHALSLALTSYFSNHF